MERKRALIEPAGEVKSGKRQASGIIRYNYLHGLPNTASIPLVPSTPLHSVVILYDRSILLGGLNQSIPSIRLTDTLGFQ